MTQLSNNNLATCSLTRLLNTVRETENKAERADNRYEHSFYRALTLALKELQERRSADGAQEPVAYLVCNGRLYQDRPFLSLSTAQISVKDRNDDAEIKPLYTAPQPVVVPVVNLPSEFYSSEGVVVQLEKVMAALAVCGIKYERKGGACRAAMLNAEPVSQPYTLPSELLAAMEEVLRISDRDHEAWHRARDGIAAYRAADQPSSGALQSPDGWRLVPVEPTMEILDEFDSIIDHGAEDSKDAWSRLLAAAWIAAPQEPAK